MTATESLDGLVARFRMLHAARHPLGLSEHAAQAFVRDASTGDIPSALRRAAMHPGLADALDAAKPSDSVAVLHALLPALGAADGRRRIVMAAATYPIALCTAIVLSAVFVYGVTSVSFGLISNATGGATVPWLTATCFLTSVTALLVLGAAGFFGLPLPLFGKAHALVDRALFLNAALAFARHGSTLDGAFRGASMLVRPKMREAGTRMAGELAAGRMPTGGAGDIGAFRAGLLSAAIARGAATPALSAIASESDSEADRWIPHYSARIQIASLLLAGASVAVLLITYYVQYTRLVAGVS